jgi:hypothetical protein
METNLLQHARKNITIKLKYRVSALRLFLSLRECTPGPQWKLLGCKILTSCEPTVTLTRHYPERNWSQGSYTRFSSKLLFLLLVEGEKKILPLPLPRPRQGAHTSNPSLMNVMLTCENKSYVTIFQSFSPETKSLFCCCRLVGWFLYKFTLPQRPVTSSSWD